MEKYNLREGDTLSLTETDEGILIRPCRFDMSKLAPFKDKIDHSLPAPDIDKLRHAILDPDLRH